MKYHSGFATLIAFQALFVDSWNVIGIQRAGRQALVNFRISCQLYHKTIRRHDDPHFVPAALLRSSHASSIRGINLVHL